MNLKPKAQVELVVAKTQVAPAAGNKRLKIKIRPRQGSFKTFVGRLKSLKRTRINTPPGKRSGLFLFMILAIAGISIFGLVMILSASSHTALEVKGSSWYWFRRQIIWLILGYGVLIVTLRVDYHYWKKISKYLLYISWALLFIVLLPKIGIIVNGARRWISLGPLTIQPVEITKLAFTLYFAQLLDSRKDRLADTRLSIRPVIAILTLFVFLILLQPDLGSAIILGAIAFGIMLASGIPLAPLSAWGGGSLIGVLLLSLQASYRRRRLLAFLDPWDDPLDTGYQTIQSLVAVSSGGFWGRGLGSGRAKWGYLPYAHTDFIFSVIAEELGLFGAGLLIVVFSVFCISGILVALRAPDLLGTMLAAGITVWISSQIFLNIGAALGALPITGVPLPLVSFGGSSLVFTMAGLGILLNIARFAKPRI